MTRCVTDRGVRRVLAGAALGVAFFATLAVSSALASTTQPVLTRFDDTNRYEAAYDAAKAAFFDGTRWTNSGVVIACGSDRAVGQLLSAAGLAGSYEAPVLLVRTDTRQLVPQPTIRALEKMTNGRTNKLRKMLIVGGSSYVTKTQYLRLARYASKVVRIGGADRYALAANVAAAIKAHSGPPPFVLIAGAARESQFSKALAAGPLCYANKAPLLLVKGDSVTSRTSSVLGSLGVPGSSRYVVGGPSSVPDSVIPALGNPTRVSTSSDRSVQAADLARFAQARGWIGQASVGMANKTAAILAAGACMGRLGGPILYSDPTGLYPGSSLALLADWRNALQHVCLFGGSDVIGVPEGLWYPPVGSVPTTGNYIYLDSEAGDYIGQGQEYLYTQANAAITMTADGNHLSVRVVGDERWSGHFRCPSQLTQLQTGAYTGLQRYPFDDPAVGGLDWSGEGRGSNTLTGWFIVDGVTYADGVLTSIDLRFGQHSEGKTPGLYGAIHWSADDVTQPSGPTVPIPDTLWRPPSASLPPTGNYVYLDSDAGDFIGQGRTYLYTPANAALTVTATGGHLSVHVNGDRWWNGNFQTMASLTDIEYGYYPDLERYPFHNPAKGGLDWSGDGRGSNTLTGWFAVDGVTYAGGSLVSIDLRFEQHCEGATPALHGVIHWAQ